MSDKKSEILGEVFSSARARLTRMLLFQLVVETNKNICFRCGKEIEKLEDLSIEHKTPWMRAENPKEVFYDLNNIAFSHFSCNSLAHDATNTDRDYPNKTGFRGVSFKGDRNLKKPYYTRVVKNKKRVSVGYYATPKEASDAYNKSLEKEDNT